MSPTVQYGSLKAQSRALLERFLAVIEDRMNRASVEDIPKLSEEKARTVKVTVAIYRAAVEEISAMTVPGEMPQTPKREVLLTEVSAEDLKRFLRLAEAGAMQ